MRLIDCTDIFTAIATDNSLPECVRLHARNTIRGNQSLSLRKKLDAQKFCVYAVKRIVTIIGRATGLSSVAKM